MPILLKLLVRNLLMGIAAGWVTLGLLIYVNTGGLREVIFSSSDPVLALVLLTFGFTVTFGSLAMGAAIMMLPYGDNQGKGGGSKIMTLLASLQKSLARFNVDHALAPVRVKDKS